MAKGIVFFPKLVNETSNITKRKIWNRPVTEELRPGYIVTQDLALDAEPSKNFCVDGYVSIGSAVEDYNDDFKAQVQLYNFSSHVLKTKAQQKLFKDQNFIDVLNKLKRASENGLLELNFNSCGIDFYIHRLDDIYINGLRSLGYKVNWPIVSWYD